MKKILYALYVMWNVLHYRNIKISIIYGTCLSKNVYPTMKVIQLLKLDQFINSKNYKKYNIMKF